MSNDILQCGTLFKEGWSHSDFERICTPDKSGKSSGGLQVVKSNFLGNRSQNGHNFK